MAGNHIGQALTVTTFGESHGPAVGCIVDGCPAGVPLEVAHIQAWLDRRRPAQNHLQSQRRERDAAKVLSGLFAGHTLGTPICVVVENQDARSGDYADWQDLFRPGHADMTWQLRYGHRDPRGGGRASARETVGRVAAAAIAEAVLAQWSRVHGHPEPCVVAWVQQVASVRADAPPVAATLPGLSDGHAIDPLRLTRDAVDASPVRCPDATASAAMVAAIEAARRDRDTLGGVVRCVVRDLPAGLGEPVFDKLTGLLGHHLGSLPAFRGLQIGEGFGAVHLRGSTHNDPFIAGEGSPRLASNHHGGVLGGITSGAPLVLEVAFKPVATLPQAQQASDAAGNVSPLTVTGRHDPCVLPRAVPMVEAAVTLALADLALRPPARLEG